MRADFHRQGCSRFSTGELALCRTSPAVTQEEIDELRKEIWEKEVVPPGEEKPPFMEMRMEEMHNFGEEGIVLEDHKGVRGLCLFII